MRIRAWASLVRSWVGIVAAGVVLASAAWLLAEYIHAVRVTPAEKVLVDSLKAKARTDAGIQKILQPEFDRQRESLARRHSAYRLGGLLLLVSSGVFLAWAKWLRPGSENWAGVPPGLQRAAEALAERRVIVAAPKRTGARRKGRGPASATSRTPAAVPRSVLAAHATGPVEIRVGLGSCGIARGALGVQAALEREVASVGGGALVKPVGCNGLCHHEPLIEIVENGRRALYGGVGPGDARQLVRRHVTPRGIARRVREKLNDARARLVDDGAWASITERAVDPTSVLSRQVRVVFENCGEIDPRSLDDYCRRDGMHALEACLARLSPVGVIEQVRASGLRDRRGVGLPTADRWDAARRDQGPAGCVVCSGDAGDPGALTDTAVLEGDPFRVIEGLAIAAYAVGAAKGIIYIRRDDTVAADRVRAAVETAQRGGLLGERILGSPFSLSVQVVQGAGPFLCGEESALLRAVEGRGDGLRPQASDPARAGLWGQPALVSDVETLATVPWVLRRGAAAFAALGTDSATGTKVLSLTGKIGRVGFIEVPMGTTVRDIVFDIGGGVPGGRAFKAVLVGGPFGGCLPASLADTRIDYEDLASKGANLGSGGLVVLDDRDCVVEIARRSLRATQNECCRTCTVSRVDGKDMLEILERIRKGQGEERDLGRLEALGLRIREETACGRGRFAPNPVLTTVRYFREEYEAHIHERRCPAASCRALIRYRVLDSCNGCTLCAQACPVDAIEARPYLRHEIIDERCTRCGLCVPACPEHAIEVS